MNHNNRGRLTVNLGEVWRRYSNTIPAGSRALGVVARYGDESDKGVLILTAAGIYSQCNAGELRSLPQSKVIAALAGASPGRGGAREGAGVRAADGVTGVQRYNVTLDAGSEVRARELGDGDRSLGIRRALKASAIAS